MAELCNCKVMEGTNIIWTANISFEIFSSKSPVGSITDGMFKCWQRMYHVQNLSKPNKCCIVINLEPSGPKVWPILPVDPSQCHSKDLLELTMTFYFCWSHMGNLYIYVCYGEFLDHAIKSKSANKFSTFLKT